MDSPRLDDEILHGVFMEVMDCGVLLRGAARVGKSELALELIVRGHCLIADDVARFRWEAPGILVGGCPALLCDFLEVRGLGIINVRAMFGDRCIKKEKQLTLIVHLLACREEEGMERVNRIHGDRQSQRFMGVEIPQITLPVAPGRNLAVLVEAAVRDYQLRQHGYNAASDFIERQRQQIRNNDGLPVGRS